MRPGVSATLATGLSRMEVVMRPQRPGTELEGFLQKGPVAET